MVQFIYAIRRFSRLDNVRIHSPLREINLYWWRNLDIGFLRHLAHVMLRCAQHLRQPIASRIHHQMLRCAQHDMGERLFPGCVILVGKAMTRGEKYVECRVGCGACCIAPSISSPLPGMPMGKPAGVRCIHLTWNNRCGLFGKPERPAVCSLLRPSEEMCGHSAREAFIQLSSLERATKPTGTSSTGTMLKSIATAGASMGR